MNFNMYQDLAQQYAKYPTYMGVPYTIIGLAGEVGELANKIKKRIRDHNEDFFDVDFVNDAKSELGDVLWYVSALAKELTLRLDDIAEYNLDKLQDRLNRNVLQGEGDAR